MGGAGTAFREGAELIMGRPSARGRSLSSCATLAQAGLRHPTHSGPGVGIYIRAPVIVYAMALRVA